MGRLVALMQHYEQVGLGNPSPAMVNDYGDGIRRIRHIKPAYSGRVLFYCSERSAAYEKLIVLTVFKKEGQEIPKHILRRAKERMVSYETRMEQ